MARAQPLRERLLEAYDAFLAVGFDAPTRAAAAARPNAVEWATATPGGPAWRWSVAARTEQDASSATASSASSAGEGVRSLS